jgi:rare lipoprotein A
VRTLVQETRHPLLLVSLAALICLPGCGRRHHKHAKVPPAPAPKTSASRSPNKSQSSKAEKQPAVPIGHTEQGIASWYGVPYHGRPAADGEIYDMETLVAAHRLLPFNTWLRVTNLVNNKSVTVRVIDRGPFAHNRIIDLSKAAARQIDLLGPGVGPVRLEVVSAPPDIPSNDFYAVQVGAFAVPAHAEKMRAEYEGRFGAAYVAVKQGKTPLYRVLVGKQLNLEEAQALAAKLQVEDRTLFVVRLDETIIHPPAPSEGPSGPPVSR